MTSFPATYPFPGFNPLKPCTNAGNTGENGVFADVHKFRLCTCRKMPETPAIPWFVHGVTAKKQGKGGLEDREASNDAEQDMSSEWDFDL